VRLGDERYVKKKKKRRKKETKHERKVINDVSFALFPFIAVIMGVQAILLGTAEVCFLSHDILLQITNF
jgi:hypothetical protein